FLSSDDDTTDSDILDTPPSPTYDTPFTKITSSTQRSPVIPRRIHLVVRHSVDHSSSDCFSPDDSARDSSSDSSLDASLDFHSDASSDSSSRHSLSDHSSSDLPSTSAGPSRKRRRSHMTSVPTLSPISGALSLVDPRETSLRDDAIVRVSDEPHLEHDIDPEIDECFAYADALRDRGIDARVVVEAVDREESETGTRGPVEVRVERVTHLVMPEDTPKPVQEGAVEVTYETLRDLVKRFHDHTEAIPVHRIQAIEGVQREQGCRIVRAESAVTILTKRVAELERDNRRLRGTTSVEGQRVDRLQKMPNTRSGASMTHEEIKDLVSCRVSKEMTARKAKMNLETLNESGDE
ncbi:hypothetical protein Tco_1490265, partial [Tanacetum coccineum]